MAPRKSALILRDDRLSGRYRPVKQALRDNHPDWVFQFSSIGREPADTSAYNAVVRQVEDDFVAQVARDLDKQDPEKKTAAARKPRPKPKPMRNATGAATGGVTDG